MRGDIALEFQPASFKRLPKEDHSGDVTVNLIAGDIATLEFQRTFVDNQLGIYLFKCPGY